MSLTSYRAAPPRGKRSNDAARDIVFEWSFVDWRCAPHRNKAWLYWPGGDLLFHVLGRSTIGAEGFHGRVRDGIEWGRSAKITRQTKDVFGDAFREPGNGARGKHISE